MGQVVSRKRMHIARSEQRYMFTALQPGIHFIAIAGSQHPPLVFVSPPAV